MFRSLIRSGVLVAALGAALAFSGTALAGPTTPQLDPIPPTVFAGPLTIKWSPSFFTPGSIYKGYVVHVSDKPPNANATLWQPISTTATQVTLNVQAGHTYIVRVRALEITADLTVNASASAWDSFFVLPYIDIPIYYEYLEWPVEPWCLTCPPFEVIFQEDPVLERYRDQLASARVNEAEVVTGVYFGRGEVVPVYAR
jgi:hypothetical protein